MKKWFCILAIGLFFSNISWAGAPTCHTHSSGPYCSYQGKVSRIYINTGNTILIYFDTLLDANAASGVGFTVTQRSAAAFDLNENPEFAKIFYSTALAAQASNRDIVIQMRGTLGGYLKLDRIWLAAP